MSSITNSKLRLSSAAERFYKIQNMRPNASRFALCQCRNSRRQAAISFTFTHEFYAVHYRFPILKFKSERLERTFIYGLRFFQMPIIEQQINVTFLTLLQNWILELLQFQLGSGQFRSFLVKICRSWSKSVGLGQNWSFLLNNGRSW